MAVLPNSAIIKVVGKGPVPTDAMPFGARAALNKSSLHKKMISGVLHLKKESVGHRSNPTAYSVSKIAFPKRI